jgi:hypothetical protein
MRVGKRMIATSQRHKIACSCTKSESLSVEIDGMNGLMHGWMDG